MVDIPIHNETDYPLTEEMTQHIIRDAQEHFGEEIRSIRVQSGLQRHALNARTREVRYAFSPQDFGMVPLLPTPPESPRSRRQRSRSDEETEAEILPVPFEDVEVDEEDMEPLEMSLESLDEGQDEDEVEDRVFRLDDQVEDVDEDDEEYLLDHEDEED